MAKAYMVVEVEYDPTVTDSESLADALDILMDTARSTPGILDEYGNPRVGEFYPMDETDILQLEKFTKLPLTKKQRDALANLLHRLGRLDTPAL